MFQFQLAQKWPYRLSNNRISRHVRPDVRIRISFAGPLGFNDMFISQEQNLHSHVVTFAQTRTRDGHGHMPALVGSISLAKVLIFDAPQVGTLGQAVGCMQNVLERTASPAPRGGEGK